MVNGTTGYDRVSRQTRQLLSDNALTTKSGRPLTSDPDYKCCPFSTPQADRDPRWFGQDIALQTELLVLAPQTRRLVPRSEAAIPGTTSSRRPLLLVGRSRPRARSTAPSARTSRARSSGARPSANQVDHLTAELRRIRRDAFWASGAPLVKASGCPTKTGSIPVAPTIVCWEDGAERPRDGQTHAFPYSRPVSPICSISARSSCLSILSRGRDAFRRAKPMLMPRYGHALPAKAVPTPTLLVPTGWLYLVKPKTVPGGRA